MFFCRKIQWRVGEGGEGRLRYWEWRVYLLVVWWGTVFSWQVVIQKVGPEADMHDFCLFTLVEYNSR